MMLQTYLYCPSCSRALYEYAFELEGELKGPDVNEQFTCDGCGWQGCCRELSDVPPVREPEPDFQI